MPEQQYNCCREILFQIYSASSASKCTPSLEVFELYLRQRMNDIGSEATKVRSAKPNIYEKVCDANIETC